MHRGARRWRATATSSASRSSTRPPASAARSPCAGLFCFIGAEPATGWLGGAVALDDRGFVLTDRSLPDDAVGERRRSPAASPLPFETSVPGVFAVGDVRHGSLKRVAAAVGEGLERGALGARPPRRPRLTACPAGCGIWYPIGYHEGMDAADPPAPGPRPGRPLAARAGPAGRHLALHARPPTRPGRKVPAGRDARPHRARRRASSLGVDLEPDVGGARPRRTGPRARRGPRAGGACSRPGTRRARSRRSAGPGVAATGGDRPARQDRRASTGRSTPPASRTPSAARWRWRGAPQRARGTIDIDVNVFAGVDRTDDVLAALPDGVAWTDDDRRCSTRRPGPPLVGRHAGRRLPNTTEFHEQAAGRARWEDFAGVDVPFLSCADLAVFKAFFNRTKDWADLEEMQAAGTLDLDRVIGVLVRYLGADDERVTRVARLAG